MIRSPSIDQSYVYFFSNLHSLQMNSSTSPHLSLRPVTRITSSPLYHKTTLPEHLPQLRCASTGLVYQTLLLNLYVLSVNAPTGHTSIMLPEKSFSIASLM